MVLSFKEYFPNGKPTLFVSKIIYGALKDEPGIQMPTPPKIHTIRAGERWKPGDKIHMATGVRTKNYYCFNTLYPELQTVVSVQKIDIQNQFDDRFGVGVDGRALKPVEIEELARNDGFDTVDDFWDWFKYQEFTGQIIHWTDKKY
jgi:hypothetical protein